MANKKTTKGFPKERKEQRNNTRKNNRRRAKEQKNKDKKETKPNWSKKRRNHSFFFQTNGWIYFVQKLFSKLVRVSSINYFTSTPRLSRL
jgi:hypothetical protein